jgi:hypothetical protein
MLFRHAVAAELGGGARSLIRDEAQNIVADPHLTPERIRRLVWEEATFAGAATAADGARIAFGIARPTDAMAASLDALDVDHRDILVAMLDAPPAPVAERDLAAAVRRHRPGLAQPMPALVDRLLDHFLRRVPPTAVAWVHPSWRDLVIDRLRRDPAARNAFLDCCGLEGALLALSVAGGPTGDRNLPLLAEDADWDALLGHVEALVADLDTADRLRLLRQLAVAFEHCVGDGDRRMVFELDALAGRVLETILPGAIDSSALVLLQEWYALADLADAAPASPNLAGLWVDTLPTAALDLRSPTDVAALETWTSLLVIVHKHDPAALERFGFPDRQAAVIGQLFDTNPRRLALALPREHTAALRRVARLLPRFFPEHRTMLFAFSNEVFPHEPSPGEDETEHGPPRFIEPPRPSIIPRVLADLDEPSPRRFLRGRRRKPRPGT